MSKVITYAACIYGFSFVIAMAVATLIRGVFLVVRRLSGEGPSSG